jgi:hypothetical protein
MFLLSTELKQSHESHGGPIFGSSKYGLTPTFPRSLLSFILPSSHGLLEKLGCTPGTLKKFIPFLPTLSSLVTHREGGHLKNLCLSRQRCMVLRIFTNSRAKVSLEGTLRGALVSNRETWWSSGPSMLVLKHTALRQWRGSLGLSNCYLFLPSGPKTRIGWLELPFLKMRPNK